MDEISLEWFGPYGFKKLLEEEALRKQFDCSGVYVWTDRVKGTERLYYVGKATGRPTLWRRQMQHYSMSIGGMYFIPEDFRVSRVSWNPDPKLFEVRDVLLGEEKYLELVREAFRYTQTIEIHLCPIEAKLVADVERNLLHELTPDGTSWGTKSQPLNRLSIRHINAKWAKLRPSLLHENIET